MSSTLINPFPLTFMREHLSYDCDTDIVSQFSKIYFSIDGNLTEIEIESKFLIVS